MSARSRASLEASYELMTRMREFEEALIRLWNDGLISGELHSGIGEEGIVAGVLASLTEDDAIALDHRATPALVARGVDLEQILLEVCGHEGGLNSGCGGHMHLFAPDQRSAGDGIVGSSAPLACGLAMAGQRLRSRSIGVAFFGEGAVNQGHLMESFNLAVAWRLPVLFVCKDNRWSITTRSREVTAGKLVDRARSFGLSTEHADGRQVTQVQAAAARLIHRIRRGKGPGLLYATCHRPQGHFTTDPLVRTVRDLRGQFRELAPSLRTALSGQGAGRPERARGVGVLARRLAVAGADFGRGHADPLAHARRRIGASAADALERRAHAEIAAAEQAARQRLSAGRAVESAARGKPASPASPIRDAGQMRVMSFDQAADAGLAAAMAEDDRVLTFGEDIRLLRNATTVRFGPDRVLDAPISEAGFLYAGLGAAMGGLRPVVEITLADFLTAAWCPLVNGVAKFGMLSGNRQQTPIVIRSAVGGWYGDGGQHEQALWGSIAGIPGLKVVVPSTPADAAGLMLASIRDDDPVVYLEPKLLGAIWMDALGGSTRTGVDFDIPAAGASGEVPIPVVPVPIGEAVLRRDGGDIALVSVGVGVHRSLRAADRLAAAGLHAAVLDLRTIAPLDRTALATLAARTGHVVVVDEDYVRGGLTGEVAAILAEQRIDARYARVAVETTIPYAPHLELRALPNVERIVAAASTCLGHAVS